MTGSGVPEPDDRPRYQQVAAAIRQQIQDGVFPVGGSLPTESELCDIHGVSRHTLREALRRLTEAGFIQRRQGSGSIVLTNRPALSYVHSMRSLDELFRYAVDTRLHVLDLGSVTPGPDFEPDLGHACHDIWLMAEGVRADTDGRTPISHVQIFVNQDFAAIAPDLRGIEGAIYRHLETHFGVEVAEVEQIIRVAPMPAAAAAAMKLPTRGMAARMAARVTRRYLDGDRRLLLVSVSYHPAARFSYSMQLRRDRGSWT